MEFVSAFARPLFLPVALLTSTGLLALLTLCIYRLFFHPYSKYPGPIIAKLTSWYAVYHTYIGDLHTDIWQCHKKYGTPLELDSDSTSEYGPRDPWTCNLVRYGPNRLLINTEEGFRGIYTRGKNVNKSKGYLRISLVPGVHPTLGTMNNEKHAKLRRILNQGLSELHIRNLDSEISGAASLFVQRLGELEDCFDRDVRHANDGWTAPKNMASWSDFFTFDVMSQLVFGTSYNLLKNPENHWIIQGVLGQMRRISFLTILPEMEDLRLDKLLFPDARRRAFRFSMKSREIMEARQAKEKKAKEVGQTMDGKTDLFSKLFAARDPQTGEGLSQKQLWAESNLLIIAGSDTSSTGLAAAFFYLSRNPSAYARAAAEVRTVFSSTDAVSQGPKLSLCTYLKACVQEALRLSPSASGAMWREVRPGGLCIPHSGAELYIPSGCEVGTGIYSLNHNVTNFPEPFAFRPERWIAAEVGDEAVARAKAAFATFSLGPRSCVGQNLAMVEILLALAAVIRKYDFRMATDARLRQIGEGNGDFRGQFHTFWAFTSMKNGPYIQFKPVHDSNVPEKGKQILID